MDEEMKQVVFETNGKTYLEQYRELIDYRNRNPIPDGVPFEIHHIRPKSIAPELANDPSNLIRLTPKEHVRAHFLLWKHYKLETDDSDSERRMCYAFWYMIHIIEWKGDAELGWIADRYEELRVDFMKRISGDNNPSKRQEVKAKMSEARKEAWKRPGVRARISETLKEVLNRPEVKAKFMGDKNPMKKPDVKAKHSKTMKEVLNRPDVRAKISAKKSRKVLQYSLDGTFVAEYPSFTEAAIKTNSCKSGISQCCAGKRKTHNGFVWKYAESK